MKRRALIIGCPNSNIPGVYEDLKNYRDFFMSPIGGGWEDEEITTLESPSISQIRRSIKKLQVAQYSVVVFSGYGHYSNIRRSLMLEIQPSVEMDECELMKGASRHTVIIDACRKATISAAIEKPLEFSTGTTQIEESRRIFDAELQRSAPGIAVMYCCSLNRTASEIEGMGGVYTFLLLRTSTDWAKAADVEVLSVSGAHLRAIPQVQIKSRGHQKPTHHFTLAEPHFPFAVRCTG